MKRTIAIKLTLSEGESQALFELQEKFSSACNQAIELLQSWRRNFIEKRRDGANHLFSP
jgi:predicted transposase